MSEHFSSSQLFTMMNIPVHQPWCSIFEGRGSAWGALWAELGRGARPGPADCQEGRGAVLAGLREAAERLRAEPRVHSRLGAVLESVSFFR